MSVIRVATAHCMPLAAGVASHVKSLLAPYEYPKEIEFVEQLPMTTTGKVQRRVLRQQEEERARQRGFDPVKLSNPIANVRATWHSVADGAQIRGLSPAAFGRLLCVERSRGTGW
jgi:hypothetical protein